MADFCNNCAHEMWGQDLPADIDVYAIAESLQEDTYQAVLCEGCAMSAIGKEVGGQIYIAIAERNQTDHLKTYVRWITLDEYENNDHKL
jgi:hypothetical protein